MNDFTFFTGQVFNGLSVASLFVLSALGLALSFGLMRVINMAHGEMLMLGGYLAYLTLHVIPGPLGILAAMPVAFIGAALVGAVLEITVIHRLCARPLDTLLATWGVSLILQQAARDIFGAIGVEVTAPKWLNHSFRIETGTLAGLNLPATRIFILFVAVAVLSALALFMARSRLGLLVRAVNQDRFMAAASGINVRQVDLTIFALGTGIAGLAGVVLALLGPVTPNVGPELYRARLPCRHPRRIGEPCWHSHCFRDGGAFLGARTNVCRCQYGASIAARFRNRLHSVPASRGDCRSLQVARELILFVRCGLPWNCDQERRADNGCKS